MGFSDLRRCGDRSVAVILPTKTGSLGKVVVSGNGPGLVGGPLHRSECGHQAGHSTVVACLECGVRRCARSPGRIISMAYPTTACNEGGLVDGGLLRVRIVGRGHRPTGNWRVRRPDVGWIVWSRCSCNPCFSELAVI